MKKNNLNGLLCYYQEMCNELYVIDSIVKITRHTCLDMEMNGRYYGTSGNDLIELSTERNNYINMLTLMTEKISNLMKINFSAEECILLEQDSNNGSREITTQSAANQSS